MTDLFDPEDFGALVALMRADCMLSVRDAADEAGVSPTTFSRVENGRAPSVETYLRLQDWLARQYGKDEAV